MFCIFQKRGYYYYKEFEQKFSLKTKVKKEATQLKKEYYRRFSIEEARSSVVFKPSTITFKKAKEE